MGTINPDSLKHLRLRKNLTLDRLAERSKVDRSTISRIERGKITRPSQNTVDRLSKALGCSAENLNSPPNLDEGTSAVFGSRSAPGLKMSDAAQNALHLAAKRYAVQAEEILDFAPLLFDLAAMESLLRRRANLNALNERSEALADLGNAFAHLSGQLVENWRADEIAGLEDKSIRFLDIRGLLIDSDDPTIDPWPINYDEHTDNPFIRFLRDRAQQIANQSSWCGEIEGWSSVTLDYTICEPEASAFAQGEEDIISAIYSGLFKIDELPAGLRNDDRNAERQEWLREQVKAGEAKIRRFTSGLLLELGLPPETLDDLQEGGI